jgi:signal peptidase I
MDYQMSDSQREEANTNVHGSPPFHEERTAPTFSIGAAVREVVETILFILLIFLILRGVIQTFRIDGQSMEPNLHSQQYILVNKIIYFHFDANAPLRLLPGQADLPPNIIYPFRMPQRGDIVVLEAPTGASTYQPMDYIKRVIALPGEVIQIKDGLVYVNGEPLPESAEQGGYLDELTDCNNGRLCEPYVVPEGHVVVLGDNRDNSQDSRTWATQPALPLDRIIGKAWLSYWPREYWAVISSPTYAQSTP